MIRHVLLRILGAAVARIHAAFFDDIIRHRRRGAVVARLEIGIRLARIDLVFPLAVFASLLIIITIMIKYYYKQCYLYSHGNGFLLLIFLSGLLG